MKNILLLYASMEGQTAKIAGVIRDHLREAGARVTLVNVQDSGTAASLDLSAYDHLVMGASIHAGNIEKAMTAFINDHRDGVGSRPRSLFIVLMAAATKDPQSRAASLDQVRKTLDKTLAVTFDDVEMIAGALMYTKYNWFIKWMMKRIVKKEGGSTDTSRDHEYTDWDQVADYARRLAG